MSKPRINRRRFLAAGGDTVAGGVAVSLVASLPASTWAKSLNVIEQPAAEVMLRVCRLLYPHDSLADDYYAACVESLDTKAEGDAALATQLKDGVGQFMKNNSEFLKSTEEEQLKALEAISGSDFFQTVRGHMVVALYTDRKVWSELGYEGPSFKFGGYLERGFNDIDWLSEG
ncbi:MAG: gluconate 2-dehydrogenase subunit 3 family protein [Gammaproteobacteria bacterium]